MVDSKLSALAQITSITSLDELYVNDGATSKRITLADFLANLTDPFATTGTLSAGASTITADLTITGDILNNDAISTNTMSGGTTAILGGNVRLYGETHATQADDLEVYGSAVLQLHYDDSASLWDFQANAITTTGTLGGGITTLTGLLHKTITDTITAGTTQTQIGATPLTSQINRVTVSAVNGDGVALPAATAGLEIVVINDDATKTIQIWPAVGSSDTIDGGVADAVDASSLASGTTRRYVAVDATSWYTA